MEKTPVVTKVDGKGLNARHFATKKKEEAIRLMFSDGITKDEKWAAEAYEKCVLAVKAQDEKDAKIAAEKQAKLAKG